MFKRALKFVAASAVLLAPTLSMVAAAPPAHASAGEVNYHWRLGQSSIDVFHDESNDADCTATFDSYYAANIDSVAPDPVATWGTETVNYHYAPGTSVTVQFAWNQFNPTGGRCTHSLATSAEVDLVDQALNVKQAWTGITLGGVSSASHTFTFPSAAGDYALEIYLSGGNENGASTQGGGCCGPLQDQVYDRIQSDYTLGVLSTGYMASLYDNRGTGTCTGTTIGCFDTDETKLGKSLSMTRNYGPTSSGNSIFGLPPASVATAASHGVGVVYSARWKKTDPNFVFTNSTTDVFQSVANGTDDSVTNGLISQITSLERTAVANKVPITFTLFHEPQEIANGYGVDGCSGSHSCFGTSAEYKSMYAHLESLVNQYGKDSVGQKWVRVMYIETDYNMKSSTDPNRPADTDFDLFGPDLYNWWTWQPGGCPGGTCTWNDAATKLGTSTTGILGMAESKQKHILIAELGTHPGCPGGWNSANTTVNPPTGGIEDAGCRSSDSTATKDTWFNNFSSSMTSSADLEKWLVGFVYFHDDGPKHDWQFVNRASSLNTENSGGVSTCPGVFNSKTCWNGHYDSTDADAQGWGTAFVTGTYASWFVGGTGSSGRQPLWFG